MKDKVITKLKELTSHNYIKLTSRGNTAIFAALYCVRKLNPKRKTILVPDQGGWFTYLKYPKMLGLKTEKIKTDYGVIDLKDLKNKSKTACAIIYSEPAGYFANQDVKEIYNICKKNNCLVILDITAALGKTKNNSDFMLASFGKWKPVNLKYGGFVSTNKKENFELPKEIFNTTTFDEKQLPQLLKNLNNLEKRYELFDKLNKKVKQDLKDLNILHKDHNGLNVVVKYTTEQEKEKIINYCRKHNLEFTQCPRYIRVEEQAISIEIKRKE
ncbi:MAG: hypothetical protein QF824_01955 [Candidatus Woesearchaeota archaeon]|jgi:hypothetical protein|nr:hypothetical protein [Candidatus Woesearchaeota archaeon]